jgi:hypothetical protein
MFNYTKIANFLSMDTTSKVSHNLVATMWLSQAPSNTWHVNCLLTQKSMYLLHEFISSSIYNNQQMFKDFLLSGKEKKTPSS